jgi:predicted alpha/beta-hydrolase family hydrolase
VVRSEFGYMGRMPETGRRQVQLGWIPSGDHSFKPTRSSGLSEAENWAKAVAWSDGFLRGVLSS